MIKLFCISVYISDTQICMKGGYNMKKLLCLLLCLIMLFSLALTSCKKDDPELKDQEDKYYRDFYDDDENFVTTTRDDSGSLGIGGDDGYGYGEIITG